MLGYNKDNKNDVTSLVIRILYRHLNREYFVPDLDMKKKILYSYTFNEWYKDLQAMISKNKLNINEDEKGVLVDQILKALEDRVLLGQKTKGEIIDMYDKINDIIFVLNDLDVDAIKLARKEEL